MFQIADILTPVAAGRRAQRVDAQPVVGDLPRSPLMLSESGGSETPFFNDMAKTPVREMD